MGMISLQRKALKILLLKRRQLQYSGFHSLAVAQVEEALFAQKWHKAIGVSNTGTLLYSLFPSYTGDLTKQLTKSIYPSAA